MNFYISFHFLLSVLNEEFGEIPVAFVVKKHGSRLSEAAVMDYVAEQVFHIDFVFCIHILIVSTLHSFAVTQAEHQLLATCFADDDQIVLALKKCLLVAGCTIQESQEGGLYKLHTKICSRKGPSKATQEQHGF